VYSFGDKMQQNRLEAGLCPDPLESLQRSPIPPSWILGIGRRGRER